MSNCCMAIIRLPVRHIRYIPFIISVILSIDAKTSKVDGIYNTIASVPAGLFLFILVIAYLTPGFNISDPAIFLHITGFLLSSCKNYPAYLGNFLSNYQIHSNSITLIYLHDTEVSSSEQASWLFSSCKRTYFVPSCKFHLI